ncbi:MAG: endonuclease III domain-containing protein, partial [Terriglobales bacterium]
MVRGVVPRQPAKTGRQEGARKALGRPKVTPSKAKKDYRPSTKPKAAKPAGGRPPAGYNPVNAERVREILKRLDELYPNATCALGHKSAWELLVATILSAQCTDVRVNIVTPGLFEKYPTPAHFAALKPEELEPDIRSTGFFRNKSKSIVGAAQKV